MQRTGHRYRLGVSSVDRRAGAPRGSLDLRVRNGIRVGILGLVVAAAITPGVAVAAEFKVDTTADGDDKECLIDCTLREAVVLAGSADQILLPNGTYVLATGELSLNNDTIIGEDARKTVIDGGDKSRVLRVIEVQSRVSNVTIRNGNGVGLDSGAGGGIFIHSGSLFLQNSTVRDNTAISGGGIAADGIAQLIGVTVSGNRASTGRLTRGGGIATSTTGALLLGNSTVSGNTAVDEVGAALAGRRRLLERNARDHRLDDRGQLRRRGRRPVLGRAAHRGRHEPAELAALTRHRRRLRRARDRQPQRHRQRDQRRHVPVQGPEQPRRASTRRSAHWPTTADRPTPTLCCRRARRSTMLGAARRSTSAASPA